MHERVASASLRLGGVAGVFGPWTVAFATAVVCALAAMVFVGLRENRTLNDARRRLVLDALRIATALAAGLLMLQPEWATELASEINGRMTVLLDVSRSMAVREGSDTRLGRVQRALAKAFDAAKTKPSLFGFGDDVLPLSRAALADPKLALRDETRIEHALRSLFSQDPELGSVLLVSDGADANAATLPAALARLGVRVHTLAAGAATAIDDTSIEALEADKVAFLREPAEIRVRVRAPHAQAAPITLTLRHGAEVLRETDVTLAADGTGTATFSFTPTALGRSVYTVSLPVPDGDAVPENNQRAFLVRVVRDKLRVLLVCGQPSWDARFLRALLKGNPAIDLITFYILRTQNDNSMAPPEQLSLIPFPTEELFEQHLTSFDLVILQDFDFRPYQMGRYLPRIHDYVMEGGSFAMLGGAHSFGAGGYLGTPIAGVLPVDLVGGDKVTDEAEFSPELVPEATHHPLVELSPRLADNVAAWAQLAPLPGVNLIGGAREGAQALLVHPKLTTPNGEPMPILVAGTAGRGRSVALLSDGSFRWGITTAGRTGDASAYERFWDRLLRWLGRDPLLDPARITTDRERYGPSAKLRASVLLRDARYRVLGQRPFRLALTNDHDEVLEEQPIETDSEGRAEVERSAPALPGAYFLSVHEEGKTEVLAQEAFVVEAGGDELADPRARPELLRAISEATGGRFSDDPSALALDALPRTRTRLLGTSIYSPFATPWFFACFVVLFGSEWWLRRRFGLR